jgi:hypothetical protein
MGLSDRRAMSGLSEDYAQWFDLSYLEGGTPRQRSAHNALVSLAIMDDLAELHPVLVGTVPLSVATDRSDLDIICEVHDLDRFQSGLRSKYGGLERFSTWRREIDGLETVVAILVSHGWRVEVFGQARPVWEQQAFLHMVVEARLLRLGGEEAARRVKELKASGWRTEPAFAKVFGIRGNAFSTLLELSSMSERELAESIRFPGLE